jgi:hypothetical protein
MNNKYTLIISSLLVPLTLLAVSGCRTDAEENASNVEVTPVSVIETTTTTVEATTTTTVEEYVEVTPQPIYEEPVYQEPVPTTIAPFVPEPVVDVPAGSIEEMICSVFGDQCGKALSVAWCESRYNPTTVGSAGERGLMQIHPVHISYLANHGLSWDDMFDPMANLTYAYALYSSQGWRPWTCA